MKRFSSFMNNIILAMCPTVVKSITLGRGHNIRCYRSKGRNMGIKGSKKRPKRNVFESASHIAKLAYGMDVKSVYYWDGLWFGCSLPRQR